MPYLLRMSLILKSRCKITTKIAHLQQNHAKVYFQARFCCKWKRATLIFLRVVGFDGFCLDDDCCVASGEGSAFGGDGAGYITRGES